LNNIAKEKAGIIKRGIPVITACDKPAALKVIRAQCRKQHAELVTCAGKDADITVERLGTTAKGQMVNIFSADKDIRGLFLPFLGAHQAINAAVAAALLLELQNFSASDLQHKKFSITEKAFRRGFSLAIWPARFQVIKKKPLVVLDGAHNPSGIKGLFKELSGLKMKRLIAVVGILRDKDYLSMIKEISGFADLVIAVAPDNPRACPAEVIAVEAHKHGVSAVIAFSPKEGLKKALKLAAPSDIICVCGSLFTCADVLKIPI